jgi:hypothetical protein
MTGDIDSKKDMLHRTSHTEKEEDEYLFFLTHSSISNFRCHAFLFLLLLFLLNIIADSLVFSRITYISNELRRN